MFAISNNVGDIFNNGGFKWKKILEDVNIFVKASLRPFIAIFICMLSQNFIGTAFGTALPTIITDMAIDQFNWSNVYYWYFGKCYFYTYGS